MQLLTSWMQFNSRVYEFELYAAAARVGVDIDALHFLVPQHQEETVDELVSGKKHTPRFIVNERFTMPQKWDMFLFTCDGGGKIPNSIDDMLVAAKKAAAARRTLSIRQKGKDEERRKVSVREIIEPLICYTLANEQKKSNLTGFWSFFCAAVIAAIPLVVGPSIERDHRVMKIVFLSCITFITFVFASVNLRFLFTATVDTERRKKIAELLSILIRPVANDYNPVVSFTGGVNMWTLIKDSFPDVLRFRRNSRIASSGYNVEEDSGDTKSKPDIETGISRNDAKHTGAMAKFNYDSYIPRIDAEIPQNIYAWMYTRLVLQNYGKRILVRINSYTGKFARVNQRSICVFGWFLFVICMFEVS